MPPPIGSPRFFPTTRAAGGIQGEEVSLRVAAEQQAAFRRRDRCHHRGIGVILPQNLPIVGVDGCDVAETLVFGILLAKGVGGPDEWLGWLVLERLGAAKFDRGRPIDSRDEQRVELR